jgi:hypothetical protein
LASVAVLRSSSAKSCAKRFIRRARRRRRVVVVLVAVLGRERRRLEALLRQPAHHHRFVAVGDDDALGAGRTDRALEAGPVGVVAEDEAAVDRAPPARAAQLHPAARERVADVAEAARPGRVLRGRRRDDERAAEERAVGDRGRDRRLGQVDAGGAVRAVERLDRAVHRDRPDRAVDAGEDALRLAERVAHDQARAAGRCIAAPPVVDLGEDLGLRPPAVDRQAERRFGDEAVAAHRLERRARVVVLARIGGAAGDVVVAGDDPDAACVLEPHLRRAEDVAGGMKAQPHAEVVDRLAVGERLQVDIAEARSQHALAGSGGEVVRIAAPRMVAVRVRDHRAIDGPPGIDVEVARRAIQPFPALDDDVAGRLHQ